MNKNKQIIMGLAVGLIILLGAGGLFLYSQNKKASTAATAPQTATSASQKEEKTDTMMSSNIADIMKNGKTTQCTFNYETDKGGTSEGKFYISGNNMRGDINSITSTGKATNVSMVKNGDTTYIWGDSLPMGVKMTLSMDDTLKNDQVNQYLNVNQKGDFKCTSWTADSAKFVAPTNIKFTDMSSMMKNVMQKTTSIAPSTGTANQAACAACNSLSGDSKTTCLQQLKCQ